MQQFSVIKTRTTLEKNMQEKSYYQAGKSIQRYPAPLLTPRMHWYRQPVGKKRNAHKISIKGFMTTIKLYYNLLFGTGMVAYKLWGDSPKKSGLCTTLDKPQTKPNQHKVCYDVIRDEKQRMSDKSRTISQSNKGEASVFLIS